jgi:hypothetical protein
MTASARLIPGDTSMKTTHFTIEHVELQTPKPYEEVAKAIELQLGRFDADVQRSIAGNGNTEEARGKIAAMAGSSGFMLFGTNDHGSLLRIVGQKRKAIQVRGRQSSHRTPDDAARHQSEPLRPATGTAL